MVSVTVTILILIDGFLQFSEWKKQSRWEPVTILILIDGFLQYQQAKNKLGDEFGHNPYFNRWFSAIYLRFNEYGSFIGHNPYFNRWFSAI